MKPNRDMIMLLSAAYAVKHGDRDAACEAFKQKVRGHIEDVAIMTTRELLLYVAKNITSLLEEK